MQNVGRPIVNIVPFGMLSTQACALHLHMSITCMHQEVHDCADCWHSAAWSNLSKYEFIYKKTYKLHNSIEHERK